MCSNRHHPSASSTNCSTGFDGGQLESKASMASSSTNSSMMPRVMTKILAGGASATESAEGVGWKGLGLGCNVNGWRV